MSYTRLSACMLIYHKGHTDTIQVYSVTVMTHVKALQAGHSSQGTSEPITPASYINQYGNNQPYGNFNTKIVNQHDQVVWK